MMIHILRAPNRDGVRVPDEVDDALLVKTTGIDENDNERVEWVVYRFPGDDTIVHRSAHLTLKKWPEGMTGIAQPFGEGDNERG
jgi:hypothetical protein